MGGSGSTSFEGLEICLIFADDVALAITSPSADALVNRTKIKNAAIRAALGPLGLVLTGPKCNNLILSPGATTQGVFRHNNGLPVTAKKDLPVRDKRLRELLSTSNDGALPFGVLPFGVVNIWGFANASVMRLTRQWSAAGFC